MGPIAALIRGGVELSLGNRLMIHDRRSCWLHPAVRLQFHLEPENTFISYLAFCCLISASRRSSSINLSIHLAYVVSIELSSFETSQTFALQKSAMLHFARLFERNIIQFAKLSGETPKLSPQAPNFGSELRGF